ncbi:MAG: DUF2130 domain-containing protein [Acidobacteriota bacterium]|nr:DUF2130 domain-containing protein [Acidobacteriota bacterium]
MMRAMHNTNTILVECPKCGHAFGVSEALGARMRAEAEEKLSTDFAQRLNEAVREAEERARKSVGLEIKDLREQLAEQQRKAEEAEKQELAFRKKTRELEEKQQKFELEIERRLEHERAAIEKRVREENDAVQDLKFKEKEKQIEDLRQALEEARRMMQQGSQERQGEVLELDIEAALGAQFPRDLIRPVPKGMRGADLIQEVCNSAGNICGAILWEVKNTKHYQPSWIDKLKQDQRATGAALAVIISVALPDGIKEFGRVDGVWIVSLRSWPALALALREQILQVAFARAASEGKRDKMQLLYAYLSGDAFHQRVEAIVEAFSAMQDQIQKERRAMERLWHEREKQIERIITNTSGMYGDIRGLIGAGMPEVRQLTLEAAAPEERINENAEA